MERPEVTIHMYQTIDGKIVESLPNYPENEDCDYAGELYDRLTFETGEAWGCGRATFQTDYRPDLSAFAKAQVRYEDRVKTGEERYCVSIDRKGKIFWQDRYNDYGGRLSRVVEVLTEKVSPEFLAYLDSKDILYIFAGKEELDFELMLSKLRSLLGIRSFVLCGGAQINGEFLRRDLVDRLDLVIAPGIQGGRNQLSFVGVEDTSGFPKYFKLVKAQAYEHNTVRLVYSKR